jgi:DNA topoisomerase-1
MAKSRSVPAFQKAFPPKPWIWSRHFACCRSRAKWAFIRKTANPLWPGFGRFGPYVSNDGAYASLESAEDVFTVGLNRAVTLLAERKEKGGRGPRGSQALKELGAHPQGGAPVKVMKGRYGPYVTDGKINATLPRDSDPNSVTMDEAVALLAARAEKGPVKKTRGKKAAPEKKPAAEKKAPLPKPTARPRKPRRKRPKADRRRALPPKPSGKARAKA